MKFGLHVSIEGGIEKAPARAFDFGAECFQIFSRSPHGGKFKKIDKGVAEEFRAECKKYKLGNCYLHTPYYINLASDNNRIYYGSISAIRDELEIADLLGASGVVTHLGSAKDLGKTEAKKKLVEGLCKIFEVPSSSKDAKKKYQRFQTKLLLEITAGSGEIMGDTFEEIASFIKETEKIVGTDILGVCFDTAHAFASGYDLSSTEVVHETFEKFDEIVGIDRIKLVHLNDSAAMLDSHVDRHANIGKGKIGIEGITVILRELEKYDLDFVLETPPGRIGEDLQILKGYHH
ncbi:MAG: deoxyribonuclease IV [Candidatus Pacebacteria bacterium]|nr:deoxyribonuclease IV [Candidatus Paceibacterota bacterium]